MQLHKQEVRLEREELVPGTCRLVTAERTNLRQSLMMTFEQWFEPEISDRKNVAGNQCYSGSIWTYIIPER